MNIYIDFAKGKIEKVTPAPIYFGNNNVDKITLYFKNVTSGIEWYPTLSALCSDNNPIYPRLSDTDGTGTKTIDGVDYTYYEFTLSNSNGWNLTPGRTLFYVWVNYPNTNGNKCVGTFGCTIMATSGYYQIDNPVINPELREWLENSFEQYFNEVDEKFDELSEQIGATLEQQTETIESLGQLQPSGTDTSTNILAKTSADGIWIATDNGHWYYWNGTQYADGGQYLSNANVFANYGNILKLGFNNANQCVEVGIYSFAQNDIPGISNLPNDVNTAGFIRVERSIGSTTTIYRIYQTLITSDNKQYFRTWLSTATPSNNWVVGNSEDFLYRGNSKELNISSLAELINIGTYGVVTTSLLSDYPQSADSRGGVLNVFEGKTIEYDVLKIRVYQIFTDVLGTQFYRTKGPSDANFSDWIILSYNNPKNKIALFGDSITWGRIGRNDSQVEQGKSGFVIASLLKKLNYVNYGIRGEGYVYKGVDNLNAIEKITSVDLSSFNYITLAWGINDYSHNVPLGTINDTPSATPTTIYSAIKYVIEYISNNYPSISITIFSPLNSNNYGGTSATSWAYETQNQEGYTLYDLCNAIKKCCEYYGVKYVDLRNNGVITNLNISTSLPDNLHPNQDTYYRLGEFISNYL